LFCFAGKPASVAMLHHDAHVLLQTFYVSPSPSLTIVRWRPCVKLFKGFCFGVRQATIEQRVISSVREFAFDVIDEPDDRDWAMFAISKV
jgi:hypothetical protein